MSRAPLARLKLSAVVVATVTALTVLSACGGGDDATVSAEAKGLDTIKPGVIKVAVQPYAPYTSMVGDKIVGLDADILNTAAKNLGLEVEPVVTDFKGMLGSVQTRRVDISIGGIAWTADRQKEGLYTDPPYYSPPAMAVASGKTYKTLDDLEGLDMGTVEGYVWVDSIQEVPGAKLHAYPTAAALFDDLSAKRIDVAWIDPLLILAAQKAGQKLTTQYLTPPTAEQVKENPTYSSFQPYMVGFYLPKKAPKLEKAISEEIDKMYADGSLTKLIKKYGGDPEQFLKPSAGFEKERHDVDRPTEWKPPTI